MGHCQEVAEYLLVELCRELHNRRISALLKIIDSQKYDHIFLEVVIHLENENAPSYWEVDAWARRIIDVSTRPDGSIKNENELKYGFSGTVFKLHTLDFAESEKKPDFSDIRKPVPGTPKLDATPEHRMLEKHEKLYPNYTFEKAYNNEALPPKGKLTYQQKASFWQHTIEVQEENVITALIESKYRR